MEHTYFVKRLFNNNAVLVCDENNEEYVLLGKGLAFNKKIEEPIDNDKIEKKFSLHLQTDKLFSLLREVPSHHITLVNQIVEMAEQTLHTNFDDDLYISLADHISFAIKRYKQNIQLSNSLLFDIRKMYHKEFEVAQKAVEIINYNEAIELDDNEAAFIAMHFINSEWDQEKFDRNRKLQLFVNDILSIVEKEFKVKIDMNSLNYNRFVVHIQFFGKRVLNEESLNQVDLNWISKQELFSEEINQCLKKIDQYLAEQYEFKMTNDEKVFLSIHLNRIFSR